ncbi:uncharacterized protein LOC143033011 [Oratosquilla oratoria]|uniref:uncharacterized protein LOC143033011 n=1 Tax=Oratosquilla oratoria TaxID=337810 RepID=UPI003F77264D
MAVTEGKKSIFGMHKLKQAIKNFLKKTRSNKEKKAEKEEKLYKVDFEAEIEENLANEALEARLRQMIEASPASLELNLNLKGSVLVSAEAEVQFGTFWTNEDDDDDWMLCRDILLVTSSPKKAEV